MRKLFILSVLLCNSIVLTHAQEIEWTEVTVSAQENTSGIYVAIGEDNLATIEALKVNGTINGYDIMIFRNKMPNLHHLDLSGSRVVANDYEYYESCKMDQDDIIGAYAFLNQSKLLSVKLPESIVKIESNAFYGCSGLHTIDMSQGIKTIGTAAFENCTMLVNVVLPVGLEIIEKRAFCKCSGLSKITLPEGLKELSTTGHSIWSPTYNEGAFYLCTNLNTIELPSTLEIIGNGTFAGTAIESISLPTKLRKIGEQAFYSCSNLKEIKIPSSIQSVGGGAFYNCI